MSNHAKGAFLTIFGGSCWGISGCVGQYLFDRQGMQSTWLVPIRLFLAGLVLCMYYLVKNKHLFVGPWKSRQNIVDLLIYGIAGVSSCQFLYFLTIQLSSAAMGTILQDISPVIILLVICVRRKSLPRMTEIISIIFALVGVILITTHGQVSHIVMSPKALLAGIASACCVAVYSLVPQRLTDQFPTGLLQGWAFLMGGAIFGLVFRPWEIHYIPNIYGMLGILVVVVVGNVLAFTCYMQGVRLIGAQRASLYSFAEPVVAAIISTVILRSTFTIWDTVGFFCIFIMMLMLSMRRE